MSHNRPSAATGAQPGLAGRPADRGTVFDENGPQGRRKRQHSCRVTTEAQGESIAQR
jgi:hypothetical protein